MELTRHEKSCRFRSPNLTVVAPTRPVGASSAGLKRCCRPPDHGHVECEPARIARHLDVHRKTDSGARAFRDGLANCRHAAELNWS